MKKTFLLICIMMFLVKFPIQIAAHESVAYKTETLTSTGDVIETQSAYTPIGLFGKNYNFETPEDVYIDKNDYVYVADSGTGEVIKFSPTGEIEQVYGRDSLGSPQGVFVDHREDIFIADYEQAIIVKYNQSGEQLMTFEKPDTPLFGSSTPFKPQKLAVDRRGNLYIVSEGTTNGIIQLNASGDFLGFYGVGTTRPSIGNVIQELLAFQSQRESLFNRVPSAPNNVSIGNQGLIHTVTSGSSWEVIRKLNVAGDNMLPADISTVSNLKDLTVGLIGNIYTVDNDGLIYEYDRFGNLLFTFGGKDDGSNRLGLLQQPTSIEVDSVGRIFISDREKGNIQMYEPTAFTGLLHQALSLYGDGFYIESEAYWDEVIRLNSAFGLAHSAKGEALYKQQQYDEALEEFRLANNRAGYSDAFWEVRYQWMEQNLQWFIFILALLFVLKTILNKLRKRSTKINQALSIHHRLKKYRLINELLYFKKFLKSPIDSYYYLKENKRVSVQSASLLFMVLVILYFIWFIFTGFIFNTNRIEDINLLLDLALLILPFGLFIVANYMVSTITDGEGRFKQVFTGTVYALSPVLVLLLPITIVSNILTLNEGFIYYFALQVMVGWSLVMLFIMIKEVHDFTVTKTIGNILLTFFTMFIAVLVFFVLYVLFDQVFNFVYTMIQEVMLRV
ncbi:YIP1 family protein [Halolactibacillus sp. JCM 19043]|uniref:YIP1 family protein n=1 Tax=Halolactibacillus sp. JCM 19043 TaxID=1460638 RepID=UPI0007803F14|nr:YIP1 family protein [Halolactibacillus sp. JCM 19043]